MLFIDVSGFLSICGFGVDTVAVVSWIYRYYRGFRGYYRGLLLCVEFGLIIRGAGLKPEGLC